MGISYYILNIIAPVLDCFPYYALLFGIYGREQFRLRRWGFFVYCFLYCSVLLACPFLYRYIDRNYYWGIFNWFALITFFLLIRDRFSKKMVVWFTAYFYTNIHLLINWIIHLIIALSQGIRIEEVYTVTEFPYDPMNVLLLFAITAVFFPPMAYFERKILKPYLQIVKTPLMWMEMVLLTVASVICVMSIIFYLDWFGTYDELTFFLLLPFTIFFLAGLCILFILVFRTSLSRARAEEQQRQMALMQESFKSLHRDMERSRELYHDLRQLLRQLYMISDKYQIQELSPYIEKIVSLTEHTDLLFCENQCLNMLFQYYTGYANEKNIPIRIAAVCGNLPMIEDTDLTLLFANILENAIIGAEEYRKKTGKEANISVDVGVVANQLAVQVTNHCAEVVYANGEGKRRQGSYLTADSFLSRHKGGGYGLKRIHFIAEKYHGAALFLFDEKNLTWTTRVSILLQC